ncbi:MAG: hypothetical protein Q8O59_00525 [bacterium]|nr:hypothetical protein [bacterium]
METKILLDDGKELEGFKKGVASIVAIVFSIIIVAVIGFYFFWEISAAGAIVLLTVILWFRRDEVKKKASLCLGVFLKRPVEIVLLGLFLGVATVTVKTTWIRYLVAFMFFVIALALYKSYEREQYEERLSEKILMEREQDGYLLSGEPE